MDQPKPKSVLDSFVQLYVEEENRRRARLRAMVDSGYRIVYFDDDSIVLSLRDDSKPSLKEETKEMLRLPE